MGATQETHEFINPEGVPPFKLPQLEIQKPPVEPSVRNLAYIFAIAPTLFVVNVVLGIASISEKAVDALKRLHF